MEHARIGVVGAGMMGAEIASVFAIAGHEVRVTDRDAATLGSAPDRFSAILERSVAKGELAIDDAQRLQANFSTTATLEPFGACDVVVEAISEEMELKKALFARLDAICAAQCVLASNTSTIPISSLAASVAPARRSHLLGTHFFSPASRMPLVEVIAGIATADAVAERISTLLRKVGKTPIRVRDVPGFAVNRLLHAFLIEAVRLVEENVCDVEDIDVACKLGLGHPVGPFQLMDLSDNTLVLQVQEILKGAYGERFLPRPLLKLKVAAGERGRKTGRGWYGYA